MDVEAKYDLITRGLQECIVDPDILKKILEKRPLRIYWGTAATGRIHVGYFVQMLKIIDYLQAGCEVTILIADLHAVLDNLKSTFKQVDSRARYYQILIEALLKSLNVDISKLKFVKGTDFQLSREYTVDMYRANTMLTVAETKHAGAETVKQVTNPKMSGLIYPTLQALDEQYLDVDAETSGVDQRKIFGLARSIMPKLGYKKRFYFMTGMIPGLRFEKMKGSQEPQSGSEGPQSGSFRDQLTQLLESESDDSVLKQKVSQLLEPEPTPELEKMSSSVLDSKIDLLDERSDLKRKINKAYCLPGDADDNCLLDLLEKVVLPVLKIKGFEFIIPRQEKHGGNLTFSSDQEGFSSLKESFSQHKLHPGDLKSGMVDAFDLILAPLRNVFKEKEMVALLKRAYPK